MSPPEHKDWTGQRLPSSWRPPPIVSMPPEKHRLGPAISQWLQTRGKVMLGAFAFMGTVGSTFTGAAAAWVKYGPRPWENPLAQIAAESRVVAGNSRDCITTVGGLTPRVVRLEEHDQTHGEQLALLRPVIRMEKSR
jgi:hypothetical protein